MGFTNRQRAVAKAVVSVFETGKTVGDYSIVAVLRDGAGISYGTHQATHGSGTLHKIVSLYCKISRDPEALELAAYLPLLSQVGKNAPAVVKASKDAKLKQLLRDAGKQPQMRYAQERIFALYYMEPAEQFCNQHGFKSTMALAIVFDSKIQGYFNNGIEAYPSVRKHLGDEKAWCKAYCEARKRWMQTTKSNPVLKNTVYRPNFFLKQIAAGNWNLDTPFVAREGNPKITDAVLEIHMASMDEEEPTKILPVLESENESEKIVEEEPLTVEPELDVPSEEPAKTEEQATPENPAAPPVPVVPTPPTIVIPPAQAAKPDGPKAWLSSVQGWWAALGLSGISFGSVLSGAASSAQTVKFLLVLGAGGLAFAAIVWVIYMVVRAVHVRAREREAHELNLRQLEIYSNPDLKNVKIESPIPQEPTDGRKAWEKIFFKKEGENA